MKYMMTILLISTLLSAGCANVATSGDAPSGEPYQLQSKYWDGLLARRGGPASVYLEIEQQGADLKGDFYFLGDRSFAGKFEGKIGSETAEIVLKAPEGNAYSDITLRLKVNEVCTPGEAQEARKWITVVNDGKVPEKFKTKQIQKMGANAKYTFNGKEEMLIGFLFETVQQSEQLKRKSK